MNVTTRSVGFLALAAMLSVPVGYAFARGNGYGNGPAAAAPAGPSHGTMLPGAPAASSCSALDLPDPSTYADALEGVQVISEKTQKFLEQCSCNTQACVADALDKYADALDKVTPRLPPVLRTLPRLVHAAAQRARVAPTPAAAVKILEAAVLTVHKTIALMRAADPDAKSVATRGGDLVADTLKTAATALAKSDSL